MSIRLRPGLGYLIAAPMLFGGSGAAARMLAREVELSSMQLGSARVLIGGAGLLVAAALLRRPALTGAAARRRVLEMALLSVIFQAGFFAAVLWGTISMATLIALGSAPVFVTAVQAVRRRRLSLNAVTIVGLALLGLALLVGPPGASAAALLPVIGAALAAGAAFGSMTLINAVPVLDADPLRTTGVAFLIAGVVLALAAAALPGGPTLRPTPTALAWVLLLGLACTAAPYGLYFTGLLKSSASVGSLFALLEPLTATLIAVALFGERLTAAGWLGAALLMAAVAFAAVSPLERACVPEPKTGA